MSLARKSCFYRDYLTVKHILGVTGIGLHKKLIKLSPRKLDIFNFAELSVFGCLGLIGNIVNIIVLNTRDLRSNCFNNLLTSLNVVER